MLQSLQIRNIALIDELEILFHDGFHILTGETGAGKSIIIDAVNFVLGERANRDLIKSGTERASVEAAFFIENIPTVKQRLEEYGIEHQEGDSLIISRSLTASGKNTVRLNGSIVNLATLKSITDLLVDVHGQHEHQSLLHQDVHIWFLDSYASDYQQIQDAKRDLRTQYDEIKRIEKELHAGFPSEQERARRQDVLMYQIREIEQAQLREEEEAELEAELRLLSNAQNIRLSLEKAYAALAEDNAALICVDAARRSMDDIAMFHQDYQDLSANMHDIYYTLEDLAHVLHRCKNDIEYEPGRLQEVEERIGLLHTLQRKYGGSVQDVIAFLQNAQEEYAALENSEEKREELLSRLAIAKHSYAALSGSLTNLRKAAAQKLECELLEQLQDLGMEHAQFQVEMTPLSILSPEGQDRVEFLLSTNKGEVPKPLQRVASGGELSRIMLAFKTIQVGAIPTVIFDEIDSGISGKIATTVGAKLLQISQEHQALCITHLPQIASMADVHYYVEKYETTDATYSTLRQLQEEERVQELARIMGAEENDIQAVMHARELIERANALKKIVRMKPIT